MNECVRHSYYDFSIGAAQRRLKKCEYSHASSGKRDSWRQKEEKITSIDGKER